MKTAVPALKTAAQAFWLFQIFPKTAVPALLPLMLFSLASPASKVIKDIDYIYMHIGLQMDYPLPESFKREKLKFEGNFKRYTSFVYKKTDNSIRFTPLRRGSAVMIIKNQKNKIIKRLHIDVQKDNLHKIAAEVRDLLITIDGIEIKINNKKVIIDGQVLLPGEMDRIKKIEAQFGKRLVESLVTYSPEAQRKNAERIQEEIGDTNVRVRYAHNRFLLEGCMDQPSDVRKALSIANLYTQFDVSAVGAGASRRGVSIIKNDIQVPCEETKKKEAEKKEKSQLKKLIQIVVHFVEMTKKFNKGFLFQWTPAISDEGTQVTGSVGNQPGLSRGVTAVLTATVANFFPKLNWAKSFNFARVLHNSSLLIENGRGGNISASINAPMKALGDGTRISGGITAQVTVDVKKLEIKSDQFIHMDLAITISSQQTGGVSNRSINTSLHVQDASSAAIGGIISSILNRGYNSEDPARTSGQPIVNLHSSKNYETSKSQFVVFVTPKILSQASAGVERIKRKFKLNE